MANAKVWGLATLVIGVIALTPKIMSDIDKRENQPQSRIEAAMKEPEYSSNEIKCLKKEADEIEKYISESRGKDPTHTYKALFDYLDVLNALKDEQKIKCCRKEIAKDYYPIMMELEKNIVKERMYSMTSSTDDSSAENWINMKDRINQRIKAENIEIN
jgi:hypothetical protein